MSVKNFVLDPANEEVFRDAMRGAMWLKFDGHTSTQMPEHIQAIPVGSLLSSFNQRPIFFAGTMKTVLETAYPGLVPDESDGQAEIPKAVGDLYAYLIEVQETYEMEHAAVRGEQEAYIGGSEPGWGNPGVGE